MNRVLIADDEERITAFVEKGLRKHGFNTVVTHDGEEAARLARDDDFDLLILDIGLPRCDGFEVLRQVRGRGERLPVIMLTARDELSDTVNGLEAGADDYMTKPFRFDELLARVRVRLRSQGSVEEPVLRAGGVALDLRSREATVGGVDIALSAREFALAETLMRHPGAVLSREQLLDRVWGYDYDGGSNVVEVYIRYLRKKIGPDAIETVRGSGYRFRR